MLVTTVSATNKLNTIGELFVQFQRRKKPSTFCLKGVSHGDIATVPGYTGISYTEHASFTPFRLLITNNCSIAFNYQTSDQCLDNISQKNNNKKKITEVFGLRCNKHMDTI